MNKSVLITGSTDGIGKLAAIRLAKEGHEVYLHGRNQEKLDSAIAEVKSESNNQQVKGFLADFSDLNAVRKMSEEVKSQLPKLEVLINNAGVYHSPAASNKDGLDMRFVVNYLAPYVLTNALILTLKKAPEPRVLNLSSAAQSPVSYDVLKGEETLPASKTYAQSKLAITIWSFYLAKELPEVSVIAVNPGSLLDTKMVKEAFGKHWSSANKGADVLYDLAILEAYKGVTGKYFDNDKGTFAEAHPNAYLEPEIDKLIKTTKDILGD